MKKEKYDYFLARTLFAISGIILVSQTLMSLVSTRKAGFEWVLPACGVFFVLSIVYTLVLIILNAFIQYEDDINGYK